MWAPDLYESTPLVVTAFIAIVPKIAILKIISNIISFNLPALYLIFFCAALSSVTIGAVGAFHQNNLSR
jgi:NADH-quinone oxidoreductase subunit N